MTPSLEITCTASACSPVVQRVSRGVGKPLQVMFILFVVAAVLWTVMVVKASPNAHRIHQLMIVLVVFKALTLLSQVCIPSSAAMLSSTSLAPALRHRVAAMYLGKVY